ncbi:MAG: hypothetical protein ACT4NY_11660 [Pseudonocardiales bacterium]
MTRDPAQSSKAHRDQLRERMRGYGCTVAQIAAEMGRRFNLRPRPAWRHALGWAQWKLALEYNTAHPGARVSDRRVSEHESWPHGGSQPSLVYLANLAATFGHGCTAAHLVDADDLAELTPAERCLLTTGHCLTADDTAAPGTRNAAPRPGTVATTTGATTTGATTAGGEHLDSGSALQRGNGETGVVWGSRRIVRCDARGVPIREEIIMAAEESAQFQRWSATTNVDDAVLEQMTADVAELARGQEIDPPALTYARLLGARDDVFRLIGGHQQPHHTTALYKIASQITAMLAMATYDLGHSHAANTHARTALHCAEMSGHTPIRVFIRRVQSNIAFSDRRYDEAAQLMEAARPDATSGTTLLLLTSRMASINAARHRPDEVTRALALAETAPTERTPDEPGVLGFDPANAARSAGDAHYGLGGAEHLDAAVDWARIALDAHSAEAQPKPTYIACARFILAHAYLGKEDLEAVREHLAPVLHTIGPEYRTVPIIGRARSLHTLLAQRTDLTSPTLTTLRDDLAGFITHPAPTPPQLEPGTPT